jgi:hypothetical protein
VSLEEARRRLQRAAHRDADQQTAALAGLYTGKWVVGTVSDVAAGTASDGLAVVSVTYRGGESVAAAWNVAATFAVGDTVLCALTDDHQLIPVCVLGGAP